MFVILRQWYTRLNYRMDVAYLRRKGTDKDSFLYVEWQCDQIERLSHNGLVNRLGRLRSIRTRSPLYHDLMNRLKRVEHLVFNEETIDASGGEYVDITVDDFLTSVHGYPIDALKGIGDLVSAIRSLNATFGLLISEESSLVGYYHRKLFEFYEELRSILQVFINTSDELFDVEN